MGRPKGSKNKGQLVPQTTTTPEVITKPQDQKDVDDLLGSTPNTKYYFVGYHPVTGEEIWQLKQ